MPRLKTHFDTRRSRAKRGSIVHFLNAIALFVSCGVQEAAPQQRLVDERAHAKNEDIVARPRLVGVGSCTAAGCHGGGQSQRIVGSEYNIWISQDPHARAYSVLFDERSQRMVRLLNGDAPDAVIEPQKDARCLACHSVAGIESRDAPIDVISDGVSCEACHGPAEKWVSTHYRLSPAERNEQGLWRTKNLVERTQTCVRCHVGSPGRDVNHDLIAAGHPRLQFEMGAYLQAMPKHWSEAEDREKVGSDFDTKIWAIGQACISQAALEQLAQRADGSKTWPEFAEWSCSACHHGLRDDTDRQAKLGAEGALSGQLIAWDTWNHRMLRQYAPEIDQAFGIHSSEATQIQAKLESLASTMRQLRPDRQQVAKVARSTASDLGRWLAMIENEKSNIDVVGVDALTHSVLKAEGSSSVKDWSNAAQAYDALASLHDTRLRESGDKSQRTNAALTRAFQQLFEELARSETSTGSVYNHDVIRAQLSELSTLVPATEAHP